MCGSTLAELHEQDLLALGVAKLGHRYRIMRALAPFSELGMLGDSPDLEQHAGQPECS